MRRFQPNNCERSSVSIVTTTPSGSLAAYGILASRVAILPPSCSNVCRCFSCALAILSFIPRRQHRAHHHAHHKAGHCPSHYPVHLSPKPTSRKHVSQLPHVNAVRTLEYPCSSSASRFCVADGPVSKHFNGQACAFPLVVPFQKHAVISTVFDVPQIRYTFHGLQQSPRMRTRGSRRAVRLHLGQLAAGFGHSHRYCPLNPSRPASAMHRLRAVRRASCQSCR